MTREEHGRDGQTVGVPGLTRWSPNPQGHGMEGCVHWRVIRFKPSPVGDTRMGLLSL